MLPFSSSFFFLGLPRFFFFGGDEVAGGSGDEMGDDKAAGDASTTLDEWIDE